MLERTHVSRRPCLLQTNTILIVRVYHEDDIIGNRQYFVEIDEDFRVTSFHFFKQAQRILVHAGTLSRMVGDDMAIIGGSKRKCPPGAKKVGPAKKRKIPLSSQLASPMLKESDSHFKLSKPNLKKRIRPAVKNHEGKEVDKAEVEVIEVVLDDDGEEMGEREMEDDSKPDDIELLLSSSSSSSPGLECEDDANENVKTENEVEARVKVENVESELDGRNDGKQEATGWLTIPSLPLGWKFREVSSTEVPVKMSTIKEMAVKVSTNKKVTQELSSLPTISTNKRQFILAPTGKIFPCRLSPCFLKKGSASNVVRQMWGQKT